LRRPKSAVLQRCQHLDDVIRFNEAIDQAIAESVAFFSAHIEQSRNLLLGMLGHDMRSPLQAIQATAAYLDAARQSR
jgi:K+-sensing histidine kinase KdpD